MTELPEWKILLVDDDAASRASMANSLTEQGYNVIAVGDGQVATDLIQEGIAVVITDLKMHGTDGLALLEIVKQKSSTRHRHRRLGRRHG